jgi:hypothetical protein
MAVVAFFGALVAVNRLLAHHRILIRSLFKCRLENIIYENVFIIKILIFNQN